jgi:hypothetical protein
MVRFTRYVNYVIKFVSDLRQVSSFLRVFWFPPPIKTDRHDITEILLKVVLNSKTKSPSPLTKTGKGDNLLNKCLHQFIFW